MKNITLMADEKLDKMAAVIVADGVTLRVDAARPLDDVRLEAKFREQAGSHAVAWKRFVDSLESLDEVVLPDQ